MITTVTFGVVGVSFIMSQRYTIGVVLIVLAALRGAHAVRQIQNAFASDDDED